MRKAQGNWHRRQADPESVEDVAHYSASLKFYFATFPALLLIFVNQTNC